MTKLLYLVVFFFVSMTSLQAKLFNPNIVYKDLTITGTLKPFFGTDFMVSREGMLDYIKDQISYSRNQLVQKSIIIDIETIRLKELNKRGRAYEYSIGLKALVSVESDLDQLKVIVPLGQGLSPLDKYNFKTCTLPQYADSNMLNYYYYFDPSACELNVSENLGSFTQVVLNSSVENDLDRVLDESPELVINQRKDDSSLKVLVVFSPFDDGDDPMDQGVRELKRFQELLDEHPYFDLESETLTKDIKRLFGTFDLDDGRVLNLDLSLTQKSLSDGLESFRKYDEKLIDEANLILLYGHSGYGVIIGNLSDELKRQNKRRKSVEKLIMINSCSSYKYIKPQLGKLIDRKKDQYILNGNCTMFKEFSMTATNVLDTIMNFASPENLMEAIPKVQMPVLFSK